MPKSGHKDRQTVTDMVRFSYNCLDQNDELWYEGILEAKYLQLIHQLLLKYSLIYIAPKYQIPEGLKESKLLQPQELAKERPKKMTKAALFEMIKKRKKSIVDRWLGFAPKKTEQTEEE